jgi:hypothetical protein
MFRLLKHAYPEHEWHEWEFDTVPRRFWQRRDNRRRFLDHMASKLNVRTEEDWYAITIAAASEVKGS